MKRQRVVNVLVILLCVGCFAVSRVCDWLYKQDPIANYNLTWLNTILLQPLCYLYLGFCVATGLFMFAKQGLRLNAGLHLLVCVLGLGILALHILARLSLVAETFSWFAHVIDRGMLDKLLRNPQDLCFTGFFVHYFFVGRKNKAENT